MSTAATTALLWPSFSSPSQLSAIERVRLSDRGLPASTYELVCRAAELWPDRPAVSVLPDAQSFHTPLVRTFAELARDVHRAAAALAALGVDRGDAVAVVSGNCAELLPLLLAAEALGTRPASGRSIAADNYPHRQTRDNVPITPSTPGAASAAAVSMPRIHPAAMVACTSTACARFSKLKSLGYGAAPVTFEWAVDPVDASTDQPDCLDSGSGVMRSAVKGAGRW